MSVSPYIVMEVMGMDNMTALVSAFARAYHYRNNHKVDDTREGVIITALSQAPAWYKPTP